jgi:hypothetical protein
MRARLKLLEQEPKGRELILIQLMRLGTEFEITAPSVADEILQTEA